MFIIDSALQHTCAEIGEQAVRGQVSAAERDLLIDGAILLAIHLETLAQDAHAGIPDGWLEGDPAMRSARPGDGPAVVTIDLPGIGPPKG